ncbi:hypothetical protein [Hymenobacter cellulosilyticus]|uniref:Uncharacterized protein n=1 Tax=Hymenobacter cellulosilyticus TaxID=2932248 RepID=A0A8T9Q0M1_9BACT|nr:hypothetical protein [Hymenobacter cellulosilyticus]UOQ70917.1 hypothetical protein MUN79_19875 [Hymenobacter cellulosilyticus]
MLGRRLWRNGTEFDLQYKALDQDGRYLAEAEQLVESFAFTTAPSPAAAPATATHCDEKMYGIAALRRRNDLWEDDCRTIHEFASDDLSAAPKIHRNALPFQSYALAKGFDNCLYSVTKAPPTRPSTCTVTTLLPARASTRPGSCRPRVPKPSGFQGPPMSRATSTSAPPTRPSWFG